MLGSLPLVFFSLMSLSIPQKQRSPVYNQQNSRVLQGSKPFCSFIKTIVPKKWQNRIFQTQKQKRETQAQARTQVAFRWKWNPKAPGKSQSMSNKE